MLSPSRIRRFGQRYRNRSATCVISSANECRKYRCVTSLSMKLGATSRPGLTPRKGDPPARSSIGTRYYPRTSALTSLAGIGRLPQVSLPVAYVSGVPIGLSLLARHGQDRFLLQVAKSLAQETTISSHIRP